LGWSPDRKYILDLLRAWKMHLLAANVGCSLIFFIFFYFLSTDGPEEPLDTTATPVEKHCHPFLLQMP